MRILVCQYTISRQQKEKNKNKKELIYNYHFSPVEGVIIYLRTGRFVFYSQELVIHMAA